MATLSSQCLSGILVELLGRELGVGVNLEIVFKAIGLDQLIYQANADKEKKAKE